MNIETLGSEAIKLIKSKWNLPSSGFVAGGSIANIIWERVSGNKAIINDIDIFILKELIDSTPTSNDYVYKDMEWMKLFNHQKDVIFYENYDGLSIYSYKTKNYYLIDSTENIGDINIINYKSNSNDYQVILDSFDINCVQVGYSIEEDKLYWTEDFIDFLKTGELKITNLQTPSHTAIRIVKKSVELNAKLDDIELSICATSIYKNNSDIVKRFFSDKYLESYKKNHQILNRFFKVSKNEQVQKLIKDKKGIDLNIYQLTVDETPPIDYRRVYNGDDLLFFVRQVDKNPNLYKVWEKVPEIVNRIDYIDCEIIDEDIDFLKRLVNVSPMSINNLRNLTLSQQVNLVKKLFDKFKDDPIIAISILEELRIDLKNDFDDGDLILMELMVRKRIINDTLRKVDRLFNNVKTIDDLFNIYN